MPRADGPQSYRDIGSPCRWSTAWASALTAWSPCPAAGCCTCALKITEYGRPSKATIEHVDKRISMHADNAAIRQIRTSQGLREEASGLARWGMRRALCTCYGWPLLW